MYIDFVRIKEPDKIIRTSELYLFYPEFNYGLSREFLNPFMTKYEKQYNSVEFSSQSEINYFNKNLNIENISIINSRSGSDITSDLIYDSSSYLDEINKNISRIIYCQEAIDYNFTSSPACRIQHDLSNKKSIPINISQVGSSSPFTALELCSSLLNEKEKSLMVVGVNKPIFPYPRFVPNITMLSDSAYLSIISHNKSDDSLFRILFVSTENILDLDLENFSNLQEIIKINIPQIIDKNLNNLNLTIKDIDCMVPAFINRNILNTISDIFDKTAIFTTSFDRYGNLSSGNLWSSLKILQTHKSKLILFWNISLSGVFGMALIKKLYD